MQLEKYKAKPEQNFVYGIWDILNSGSDQFGAATRSGLISPEKSMEIFSKYGAKGIEFHDNDLVPIGTKRSKTEKKIKHYKKVLGDNNLIASAGTCNLFSHPVFKDGAFTSADPNVRAYALQKAMYAIDMAADLGAKVIIFWPGREGSEVEAGKNPSDAKKWMIEGLNYLSSYVKDKAKDDDRYQGMMFSLEPKPNEPRGDIYMPTLGHALALINELENSEMYRVNPETAHEDMAGLNIYHAMMFAGPRLFEVHMGDQRGPRYDQDLRFGSANPKRAFYTVLGYEKLDPEKKLPRAFDSHPLRTSGLKGVETFVASGMHMYDMLEKAVGRFNNNTEAQELLRQINEVATKKFNPIGDFKYSSDSAEQLKKARFPINSMAKKEIPYEQLDWIVDQILLGNR